VWKSPPIVRHEVGQISRAELVHFSRAVKDRFGFNSMPATLLIDRNDNIADLHVGMVDKDAFESEIQILLKESASNKAVK